MNKGQINEQTKERIEEQTYLSPFQFLEFRCSIRLERIHALVYDLAQVSRHILNTKPFKKLFFLLIDSAWLFTGVLKLFSI